MSEESGEELLKKAAALLEVIESLDAAHKKVAGYFIKHISVGDLRAVLDLKKMGVENPEEIIEELVELGILEKGIDCYNLSKPMRYYVFKRLRR
jgi:hypothetical protein